MVSLVRGKRKADDGGRFGGGRRDNGRGPWPGGPDKQHCRYAAAGPIFVSTAAQHPEAHTAWQMWLVQNDMCEQQSGLFT